jgi:uncharacterized protein (TIGR02284 family)
MNLETQKDQGPGFEQISAASFLRHEHGEIARGLARVVDFIKGEDSICAREEWAELEETILRHLEAEEMFILPPFEVEHRGECQHLRDDHAEIRKQMGEIGLALDLHTVRAEHIESFAALLTRHANEENACLYPWAESARTSPLMSAVARRVGASRHAEENSAAIVLQSLVRFCKDGERGYRDASRIANDEGYRLMFSKYADQRAGFASALRSTLQSMGAMPPARGSWLGTLHRGWIGTSTSILDGDAVTILRECERGERAALKAYRIALHAGLAPQTQEEVEDQYEAIKSALEEVRTLLAAEQSKTN